MQSMKKINFILIFMLVFSGLAKPQVQKICSYQYWFDNNFSNKTDSIISTPVADYTLQTLIPTNNINTGFHTFHIRFKSDSNIWSGVISRFFQKLPVGSPPANNIDAYEYWVDNNYSGKITVNVSAGENFQLIDSIPFSSLANGLHTFHIRFKDERGQWSSVQSQFFQKLPSESSFTAKITSYEYWVDNNYSGKISTSISPVQNYQLLDSIPFASLVNGLHTFHIRFKDERGQWSGVISQFFQKLPAESSFNAEITSYEYWIDNNYSGKISNNISPVQNYQLLDSISFTSLVNGLHTFHIRFKDERGQWSGAISQFFQKLPSDSSFDAEITEYEYWIDNNYSGKVLSGISPVQNYQLLDSIPFASLTNGLHTFHIRFKDERGLWSNVLSQFFQKLPSTTSNIPNLITAYTYWIDMDDSATTYVKLPVPVNPYNLIADLDLKNIHKGNHEIHFQFQDTLKQWSSVLTDSIYKYPTVVADFSASDTLFCDSGLVTFTNISFDADTFLWKFDDSTTSNLTDTSHFFNTCGTHPVMLIAADTTEGVVDTLIINITVAPTPTVNIGNDNAFCYGNSITLDAGNPGSSYSWSDGSTTSTINADNTEQYSVEVTTPFGCSNSDTINITVCDLPTADAGDDSTICEGQCATLTASGGTSYLWNTDETTQEMIICPGTTNTYSVTVTDINGCENSDEVVITVNTLPTVNLGNDTIIPFGNSITLDATTAGATYLWSTGETTSSITADSSANYSVVVTKDSCSASDTIMVTVAVDIQEIMALNYNFEAYPNPYKESTNISYKLNSETHIKLEIINVLGEKIEVLADEEQLPGKHTYTFNSGNISNSDGIYIIKLHIGNNLITKEIVRIK